MGLRKNGRRLKFLSGGGGDGEGSANHGKRQARHTEKLLVPVYASKMNILLGLSTPYVKLLTHDIISNPRGRLSKVSFATK